MDIFEKEQFTTYDWDDGGMMELSNSSAGMYVKTRDYEELLQQVESLRNQLSTNTWISVEDRLPTNPDERVLALEDDGEVYRLYYRDGKWLDMDLYEYSCVHGWIEMPNMYDYSTNP